MIITSLLLLRSLEHFDRDIRPKLQNPDDQLYSLKGNWRHQASYQLKAQGFNLRFNYKPWFIVYCRTKTEVAQTYQLAVQNNLPVRIRATGHDHESECSGDGTVVIDVSEMDERVVDSSGLAKIGPGNDFVKLTTALAKKDVMIAHGACGTVGIAGFTLGGGWGPWTRKHGMCCERLVGATVVLGDGTIVDVSKDESPELLWALSGGGGMSFGLVTEFRIQTFPLPDELISFDITWNPYSDQLEDLPKEFPDYPSMKQVTTLDVVRMWETAICSKETSRLIGTNLLVNGCPLKEGEQFDYRHVYNNCKMFGYWEGTEAQIRAFVLRYFGSPDTYTLSIDRNHGGRGSTCGKDYGDMLMTRWARQSTSPMIRAAKVERGVNIQLSDEHSELLEQGKPLPDDTEDPAPHKITSRLVQRQGLGPAGHKAYIESLWSPLILPGNRELGLSQYTTLGAITGDFYRNYVEEHAGDLNRLTSFPYKDKLYTIQYQTWWNHELLQQHERQNNPVYDRTNRALDWIEMARDADIPNTTGAFISFKDSSVKTETYFAESYEKLVDVKEKYVRDPLNHLRIRKSII